MMAFENRAAKTIFFDRDLLRPLDDYSEFLTADRVRKASLAAHERNSAIFAGSFCPEYYDPVVPEIIPVPPRSGWLVTDTGLARELPRRAHERRPATLEPFVQLVCRSLKLLGGRRVAVELSGGLDSALIQVALEEAGVEPVLLGIRSHRYEFRTERVVQERLAVRSMRAILIPETGTLPYLSPQTVHLHPLPTLASLYHMRHARMVELCAAEGVSLLLNGVGGDVLFCEGLDTEPNPLYFQRWVMCDGWASEYVYAKAGIAYVAPYTWPTVIKLLRSMRNGEPTDRQKRWARSIFAAHLPRELSAYAYKGAHDAAALDGLLSSIVDLAPVFAATYAFNKNESFLPSALREIEKNYIDADRQRDIIYMARISFAMWVYALIRDGVI